MTRIILTALILLTACDNGDTSAEAEAKAPPNHAAVEIDGCIALPDSSTPMGARIFCELDEVHIVEATAIGRTWSYPACEAGRTADAEIVPQYLDSSGEPMLACAEE
jgi:hypothetical protein